MILTSRSSWDWPLFLPFSLRIRFSWFFVCWVTFVLYPLRRLLLFCLNPDRTRLNFLCHGQWSHCEFSMASLYSAALYLLTCTPQAQCGALTKAPVFSSQNLCLFEYVLHTHLGVNLGLVLVCIQNYRIQLPEASLSGLVELLWLKGTSSVRVLREINMGKGGYVIAVLNMCAFKNSRGLELPKME